MSCGRALIFVVLLCVFAAPARAAEKALRVQQIAVRVAPFWQSLAKCETNGRWNWGRFHRPGEGTTYQGGLGFYAGTWTEWSRALGVPFAHAWQAPAPLQVRVAAFGLAHGGYWGCLRGVPSSEYPRWSARWLDLEWFIA